MLGCQMFKCLAFPIHFFITENVFSLPNQIFLHHAWFWAFPNLFSLFVPCDLRCCYWDMNFQRMLSYHSNRSHICLKINKVPVNNETTKLSSRNINPFIVVSYLSTDDNLQLEINFLSYGCLWLFTTHFVVSEPLKQGPIFSVKTY